MEYYVNSEEITIDETKKPFDQGSEGKLYKIGDKLYKIYYKEALCEGHGNKFSHHSYFLTLKTSSIELPHDLIFDKNNEYVGYVTKIINGDRIDKTGITLMNSKQFIKNIRLFENDVIKLGKNHILMCDVSTYNYLFDNDNFKMHIIDPGRYHIASNFTELDCIRMNLCQLDELITLLLYLDMIKYKSAGTKRKAMILKDIIHDEKGSNKYSEYLSENLVNFETPMDFIKYKSRFVK